jgi:predicted RNA methylase
MFNSEFFPTPKHVIERMVGTYDLNGKHVLEPSAGKGDIVDVLTEMGAHVSACEQNRELAKIVASKAKFLSDDFFKITDTDASHFDYIIMNPPFSNADRHILHAWEIAPNGCEIIALCNWETVNNRHSQTRTRLGRLIKDHGGSVNLGDVFSDAERKTGVEIGLVQLFKPANTNTFEGFFDEEQDEHEDQYVGIMPHNVVRETVQRYVAACKLFDQVADNAVQMNSLVGAFRISGLTFSLKHDERDASVESFKSELQKNAWDYVFNKMNMQKFLTEGLKKELNAFVEKQKNVPFTMRNIYRMLEMVVGTHQDRMQRALVEVFDKLTMHHHENRYHVEGWKTNSQYMVNKKFILEFVMDSEWGSPRVRYQGNSLKMDDLTKALCFLTGENYDKLPRLEDVFRPIQGKDELGRSHYHYNDWNVWYDFGFFEVKGFKKGTLHARFKDKNVWELFNRTVAKAKGYELPEKI